MHKSFSFKGINRSTDALTAQDGECLDIVNLRMSNGCLRPMPKGELAASLANIYSGIFRHEIAGCYVCITDDVFRTLHFFNGRWQPLMSGNEMLAFSGLRRVRHVEFIGNVVCCLTQNGIFYLLFEHGTYRWLGERPEIPVANISVTSNVKYVITENSYYRLGATDELENSWNYNEKGFIDECISMLNKEGHYIDRALFRVALRLYDGSYINCSNIIYMSDDVRDDGIERDDGNLLSEPLESGTYSPYRVRVRGFKVVFSFDTAALASWKNIVVGIDLFSTASIMGKKSTMADRTLKYELYTAKSLDELWNDVANASLYYKVAEFDIDGNLLYGVEDVSPVNLALQQELDTSLLSSSFASIDAGCSYVYNGRLHIGSLREYLFKGYDVDAYIPVSVKRKAVQAVAVHTKVRTTQGDLLVEKYFNSPMLGHDGYSYVLPPMLSYPDARACEMTIYIIVDGVVYRRVFPLKAHSYLNMAYYLHKSYSPYTVLQNSVFASGGSASTAPSDAVLNIFNYTPGVYEVVYSASTSSWMYNGNVFPPAEYSSLRAFAVPRDIADGDKIVFTIKRQVSDLSLTDIGNILVDEAWGIVDDVYEIDDIPFEERHNVLKVSMTDNPFVFQAKATYTPSQGGIVGMSGNTTAMSQGQFGQFPLYVFCSDGIWAMQVDTSGSMAYWGAHQVSRDVCVNSKSICGVSGGVVFAASNGLLLITGNSVKKISAAMEGPGLSPVGVPSDIFGKISALVGLDDVADNGDFSSFMENATVTYLPSHHELLLSNAVYGYSYVYSFESGFWSRFAQKFHGKVQGMAVPHMFVQTTYTTAVIAMGNDISGSNRVMLCTRPQLWGTKLPKRVMQLLLHAFVEPAEKNTSGMPLLACYMLCSNDGVHFKLISGCEKRVKSQDAVFPYFPTQSYKYFLFAIVGEMGKKSAITGMEVDVNPAWNNKLR